MREGAFGTLESCPLPSAAHRHVCLDEHCLGCKSSHVHKWTAPNFLEGEEGPTTR